MDYEKLVKVFLKIRKARSDLKAAYEADDAKLKAQAAQLDALLLKHLNDTNASSMATAAGTFYRQEEVTPTGSDWEAFYTWVKANDAFDALERRIKKTFIREWMDTHDGAIPPGVSVYREYVVRVRKAS